MSGKGTVSPLFTWRTAIAQSRIHANAKHIALTLSLWMNDMGDSAFPGQDLLADASSRSKSTVREGLRCLEDAGYLEIIRSGRSNGYIARVPLMQAIAPDTGVVESESAENRRTPSTDTADSKTRPPDTGAIQDLDPNSQATPPPVGDQNAENRRSDDRDPAIAPITAPITTPGTTLATASPRDLPFEALCEVCSIDWNEITDSGRGPMNKALAQIRGVVGTRVPEEVADEIRRRARNYWLHFPHASSLTAPALAKHWPLCGREPVHHGSANESSRQSAALRAGADAVEAANG